MAQNLEPSGSDKHLDEIYLKIWEVGHNHTNTRWTNTTFFLTVSFAIFGFSFHPDNSQASYKILIAQRAAAVLIYWFAFALFRRFNYYTTFIRKYLLELEREWRTPVQLHAKAELFMQDSHWRSSTKLLFAFGVVYTVGAGVTLFLS